MSLKSDPDCPFCQKLANPSCWPVESVIWQFPYSIALLGQWQYYTGYCLLVSRQHATELSQLGATRSSFLNEMAMLAEAIEIGFQPHKMNYELLGNQVPHLHWHLFPRSAADHERLKPVWSVLEKAESDPVEKHRLEAGRLARADIAVKVREALLSLHAPQA